LPHSPRILYGWLLVWTALGVCEKGWSLSAPSNVRASDIPNDDGGRGIVIRWEWPPTKDAPPLKGFVVLRRGSDETDLKPVSGKELLPPQSRQFEDKSAAPKNIGDTSLREPAKTYIYVVRAHYPPPTPETTTSPAPPATAETSATPTTPPPPPPDRTADSPESNPAQATGNWFHFGRIPILLATLFFGTLLWVLTQRAKAGSIPKIRRIPGLEAVDEAIGRATEMGRPILFVPGIGGVGSIATMSAMNIYGHVAKKAGELGTSVHVPGTTRLSCR